MVVNMKEIGKIIKWMEKELIDGQPVELLPVHGKMAICTDKVYMNGLMEEYIKVSLSMT